MRRRKLSFTIRYVLIVGVLLFLANTALGIVILSQSKDAMSSLINKNMLDVVNSAAYSLDGDVLGSLTANDVDGPAFREIEDRLLVFQHSVDIEFIYAVKQVDEDTYVFTVDPDPVDPGDFGEEVLTTPALVSAAHGTPSVDESAAQDRWGNFYSAYSPVYDSEGNIAGVVGIDFEASWYNRQIWRYSFSIAFVTFASVLLGGIVMAFITNRVRLKFRELDSGLSQLSQDVDQLMEEMASYSGTGLSEDIQGRTVHEGSDDELGRLEKKIHFMQGEMGLYLDYLHTQAYTDSLTRVGNTTAYHEAVAAVEEKIAAGTADFTVAVYDMNSLKLLNDTYGHEVGDVYIQGAAHALATGFGETGLFRVGGDEFAVIAEGISEKDLSERLVRVEHAIEEFNADEEHEAELSVSCGTSCFEPGADTCFKDVFTRADAIMYERKRAYYRAHGLSGRD